VKARVSTSVIVIVEELVETMVAVNVVWYTMVKGPVPSILIVTSVPAKLVVMIVMIPVVAPVVVLAVTLDNTEYVQ